jgi:serine/threonine protein phosphatase PrpC
MSYSLAYESVARTHVGRVRELNEDRFVDRPLMGLWAVADGMGGHQAGDVASGMIAEALDQIGPVTSGYVFLDEVRESLAVVNRSLVARAAALQRGSVIGSTVVVLLSYEGHFACLWAGDSRGYVLRQGTLRQITRDHSLVQQLVDSGDLSAEDAKRDRRSNVITRAVGVHADLVVDVVQGMIESGDIYLLCSDGLTGHVEDAEIEAILAQQSLEAAAETLISLALERGGKDNVTLVVIAASPGPDDTATRTTVNSFRSAWPGEE